jgi:hypothetical protein
MKRVCLVIFCLLIPAIDIFGQTERVLSRAEKKQNTLNFIGTTGFNVNTKIQVYSGLSEIAQLKFKYPDLSLMTLKERSYYQLAAKTLLKAGWNLSDETENVLTLKTSIDDGTTKEYTISTPVYGAVPIGSGTSTSNITVKPYSNSATVTTSTVPKTAFGVVGYNTNNGTTTTFKREIIISIVNQTSQVENYRYELTSSGPVNDINSVAPYMFSAIPIIHNKVDLCCGIYHNWKTQYTFSWTVGSESIYGKQFTWEN